MTGLRTCLVTGGAGFIGTATVPLLLAHFDRVLVVDSLHPQVHGVGAEVPLVAGSVTFVRGDIVEPSTWEAVSAQLGDDRLAAVLHLAAETGTGQSLLESTRHASVNVVGTTVMLDHLARTRSIPERIVVASSRAVYGEGAWIGDDGQVLYPGQRTTAQLEAEEWDVPRAMPAPMSADLVAPMPVSVYGVTKLAQEQLLRTWSTSFGVDLAALRLQNVYGPGQSLTNSYTGIMQVFARIAREGDSIPLYEDGEVRRDFVHIADVAAALKVALTKPDLGSVTLDIGSGSYQTIAEAAAIIAERYAAPAPHVTGQYRQGDVRHAWADTSAAQSLLDWQPQIGVHEGLNGLIDWVEDSLGAGAPGS